MRDLNLREVQGINGGGDAAEFVDGACAAVGVASVLGYAIPGVNVVAAACTVWSVGRLLG